MNIGSPFKGHHYHMPIRTRSGHSRLTGGGWQFRQVGIAIILLSASSLLYGCVAQQADLNKVDRDLRQASVRIKQQADELEKTRARQSQDIMNVRDAMPALEGKLDEATHHAKLLQQRQEDLIVQQSKLDKRLSDSEKRAPKMKKRLRTDWGGPSSNWSTRNRKARPIAIKQNPRSPR